MSYTLKRAVTGSGKEIKIDFDRALVSMGTLMPVFEGTATQDGNKMHFKWQDNSGMGNAEDTDIAMLLVYNKDEETAVYDTEASWSGAGKSVWSTVTVRRMLLATQLPSALRKLR